MSVVVVLHRYRHQPARTLLAGRPTQDAAEGQPADDGERLERAQQKVRDLLQQRRGAKTALIAYAGSAHMVLPFTDDPDAIDLYLSSLGPELMPVPGKDTAQALALAQQMLAAEETPGTILFLN